ncbi:MAG TPA: response regulator [Halomonas sp.]|nr:response regulator [Halomonas sp.]
MSANDALDNNQDHVLIIEDDERLATLTGDYLRANGFRVSLESDGARGVERILELQPDLVVLDLMLPGEDGMSICRRVRTGYKGPILMLTARTDDAEHIEGLEMGADDFVPKPVQPRVLLARMRALLRRSEPDEATQVQRLAFGRLEIDSSKREAWLDGRPADLTSAEFDLLWLLATNAGRVLTREEIFVQLRGIEYDGQDRSIDVRVSRIRPKVGDDPHHPQRIKTVRSKGYLFVKDI